MPTVVQKTPGNKSGGVNTNSLVLTFSAAVTSGNGVVVSIGFAGGAAPSITSITDDKGNSYAIDGSQSASGTFLLSASLRNITNAPTIITIAGAATGGFTTLGLAYEMSSLGVVDAYGQFISSFGAGPFSDTFTTAHASEYGFGIIPNSSTASVVANNGWSIDYNDTATQFSFTSDALPTSGSNTQQFSPSGGSATLTFQHATYQNSAASSNSAPIAWVS